MWKRRLSHLHVLHYSTSWIPQIPTSYKALNYETRSLFPNKIHPPATTACSIVARKLITECNELLFSFPPTQLSLRPRNEIDECSRMLESRKAHSAENYCRGLIFAPFAPGGKISKSIPLWNVLRARVELIIGSSPELASVEGNKRRKRSTDLWPLSNERRTSPPPPPPSPLSSPPSPRTVFVSPFYWLAQNRSPSGSYYYQPSFGSSLLSASISCLTFSFVCSFVGVEWDREGIGR